MQSFIDVYNGRYFAMVAEEDNSPRIVWIICIRDGSLDSPIERQAAARNSSNKLGIFSSFVSRRQR